MADLHQDCIRFAHRGVSARANSSGKMSFTLVTKVRFALYSRTRDETRAVSASNQPGSYSSTELRPSAFIVAFVK